MGVGWKRIRVANIECRTHNPHPHGPRTTSFCTTQDVDAPVKGQERRQDDRRQRHKSTKLPSNQRHVQRQANTHQGYKASDCKERRNPLTVPTWDASRQRHSSTWLIRSEPSTHQLQVETPRRARHAKNAVHSPIQSARHRPARRSTAECTLVTNPRHHGLVVPAISNRHAPNRTTTKESILSFNDAPHVPSVGCASIAMHQRTATHFVHSTRASTWAHVQTLAQSERTTNHTAWSRPK